MATPETDYYRLRTEWLRFKSQLFDGMTGLPALPAVLEDIRRMVEDRGFADVRLDLGVPRDRGGLRLVRELRHQPARPLPRGALGVGPPRALPGRGSAASILGLGLAPTKSSLTIHRPPDNFFDITLAAISVAMASVVNLDCLKVAAVTSACLTVHAGLRGEG